MEFDYIVVGAGTAGCVLADRLTEQGDAKVLLLEAGPVDGLEMLHVPAGFNYVAFDRRVIWDYKTEPEPGLSGRRIDYVRGRVLGGSSSINAMVHVRGNPADYDGWERAGCPGWGWTSVLPAFIRSERHAKGASLLHGDKGALIVTPTQRHPASDVFIQAMVEAGIPPSDDFDGAVQEGAGYYHQTVSRGRRQSLAKAYLKRARRRQNLLVRTSVSVHRVQFDGSRATGVEFVDSSGARNVAVARCEVILSAGTVGSAQLLELSGIGAADRLQSMGIPVRVHSSEVGENVQDHYQAPVVVGVEGLQTLNQHASGWGLVKQVIRYYAMRDGLLAYNAAPAGGFLRSSPEVSRPDLQILYAPGALDPSKHPRRLARDTGVTAIICPLAPRSIGNVHIKSADANIYPTILGNYLADAYDRHMMVTGLRWLRKIFSQPGWQPYFNREIAPGASIDSDEALLDYARRKGDSVHHPVGSCRMGSDAQSVVDPELKVRGVSGLRVIDASIMPRLISGNTNAATVMIAERGAEFVLNSRKC